MAQAADRVDINKLWEFRDTKETRKKFHALRLELLTQIARTHGLESDFDKAHAVLDEVEQALDAAPGVVKVRYLLERGRTLNSSGKPADAVSLFHRAFELGRDLDEHGYAVDALHMVAYTEKDPKVKLGWEEQAVAYAEKSKDERALKWLGTLYNNMTWSYFDMGEFGKGLGTARKAEAWHAERHKDTRGHRIARWSVGKLLRMIRRYDEALKIQLGLQADYDKLGEQDGFVQEELGEIYLARGEADAATPHFKRAYELLRDTYVKDDKARIERLKKLAAGG